MMVTIGDLKAELDALVPGMDIQLYKDFKEKNIPLSYNTAQQLAKDFLSVVPRLQKFLDASKNVTHKHIGTPIADAYTQLEATVATASIASLTKAFDPQMDMERYIAAAIAAYTFIYLVIYTHTFLTGAVDAGVLSADYSSPFQFNKD